MQRALKGKRFESTDEQNAWLLRWNESWASTRIHGTTKRQVQAMFNEERPHRLPLTTTRLEYYQIAERRVHLDGHIEVQAAYYPFHHATLERKWLYTLGGCGCASSTHRHTS